MHSTLVKTCHDGKKRDTIMETLIWVVCYTTQKRVTIYLNRATILGEVVAY